MKFKKQLNQTSILAVCMFAGGSAIQAETYQPTMPQDTRPSSSMTVIAGTSVSKLAGASAVVINDAPVVQSPTPVKTPESTTPSLGSGVVQDPMLTSVSSAYQACASNQACQSSAQFTQLSLVQLAALGQQTQNETAFLNSPFAACAMMAGCQVTAEMQTAAGKLIQNYPQNTISLNAK